MSQLSGLVAVRRRVDALTGRVRRANPYLVDAGIAFAVAIAMSVQFVVPRAPSLPDPTAWSYLCTVAGAATLVWRRRFPLAVLLAANAAMAANLLIDGVGQPLPYPGLLAAYTVAAQSPFPQRMVMNAVALIGIPAGVWANTGSLRELLFTLFTYVSAYAFGRLTAGRRDRLTAYAERAAAAERTRAAEAERAVAAERARIAREMHDVLSHAVAIMIVQAEAGPVAVRTKPERAEQAFDAIAEAGRDAMTQLRRMLGVLKDGSGEPGRLPQPTLDELPRLAERASAGGLDVRLTSAGTACALPADMQMTMYRIVQEALTNVVKHAGATRVDVRLIWLPDRVGVAVVDDGVGPTAGDGRGHGMIGFTERAAAYGGSVECGPGPGGRGFQVRAEFPLTGTPEQPGVPGPAEADTMAEEAAR